MMIRQHKGVLVRDAIVEYAIARRIGGGWYRGKATQRFTCFACEGAIAEGTDVAVRSRERTFQFLHGVCFEQWQRK